MFVFVLQVKVVDEKAFKQVVEEEIRKNDRQENETMPQVTLSRNNVSYIINMCVTVKKMIHAKSYAR